MIRACLEPLSFGANAGFFQPKRGQIGCLSCDSLDSLGNFYEEKRGQITCQACADNTQRYVGVLSASNRSACQCKEGATA